MNLSISPATSNGLDLVPLQITVVKPAELHSYWPFVLRGLNDIRRKVETDWIPPDVYTAVRTEAACINVVNRGPRRLGFFIWHKQERPFSHVLDIFVWAAWALPLRERYNGACIDDAIRQSIAHLHEIKRSIGAQRIIALTSRPGLAKRYGLKTLMFTVEI